MRQTLGQLADIRSGYSFRTALDHDDHGPIGVLQIKDIKNAAQIDPAALTRIFWTIPGEPTLLRPGDIVLPARGEHYPAAMVPPGTVWVASSQLHIVRPTPGGALPAYLCWYLNHADARGYILKSRAGTSIPMLSRTALAAMPVPVPAMTSQHCIADLGHLWQREQALTQQLLDTRRKTLDGVFHKLLES